MQGSSQNVKALKKLKLKCSKIVLLSKISEEKEEMLLLNASLRHEKTQRCKLQPKLAWRQLKG